MNSNESTEEQRKMVKDKAEDLNFIILEILSRNIYEKESNAKKDNYRIVFNSEQLERFKLEVEHSHDFEEKVFDQIKDIFAKRLVYFSFF